MKIILTLLLVVNAVILISHIRLIYLALSGLPKAYITYPQTDQKTHFAVFIPARNEEMCIGRLLESLSASDYPAHLREVYVLLNSCTDRTEEIAYGHGAAVISCPAEVCDKAGALRVGFDHLARRGDIDAFIVMDADTVADTEFFKELNKAFVQGATITQGKRRGLQIGHSWVAQSYEVFYAMQNAFFNHARAARGLSASVNGSGWAVARAVIERDGFDTGTIAEDMEYTLQAALKGEHIAYCEDAVVYDDFVSDLGKSIKQRFRWSMGNTQCLRRYGGRLIRQVRACFSADRSHALECLDKLTANMIPVIAAFAILSVIVSAICTLCMALTGTITKGAAAGVIMMIITGWIMTSLIAVIALKKAHISALQTVRGVMMFPLFMATWFPLMIISFFRREVQWAELRG